MTLTLAPRSALVVVDLQQAITALPTIHPAPAVVAQAARLAEAFRAARLPVALVTVLPVGPVPGGPSQRVDEAPPAMDMGPDFARLAPELGSADGDIRVTKRAWDAFCATELDLRLRRHGVTGIVLAGIRTAIGVESTARHAHALGYEVVFAADAMTDLTPEHHEHSLTRIFPRLGRVTDTETVLAALGA
jgi:nicotinamidase-related amidase